jgi:hypothetical protein
LTTYQERFAEACKINTFEPHELSQGPKSGFLVWRVRHVRDGESATIDGPFFTKDEAQISADLLRGGFSGAHAEESIHNRIWRYDPRIEQEVIDQAQASRKSLARQLGVDLSTSPIHAA